MQLQIKCSNKDTLETSICTVSIYHKNSLIYQRKTTLSGVLDINLPCNIYNIVVTSKWGKLCKSVLVNSHLCHVIPFLFSNPVPPVTFILTDCHYGNMPIQEGVITLWHNM